MGLLDTDAALQNATKCDTWHEIKASHASDGFAPLKVNDFDQVWIYQSNLYDLKSDLSQIFIKFNRICN